jgi:hypothetical protein
MFVFSTSESRCHGKKIAEIFVEKYPSSTVPYKSAVFRIAETFQTTGSVRDKRKMDT